MGATRSFSPDGSGFRCFSRGAPEPARGRGGGSSETDWRADPGRGDVRRGLRTDRANDPLAGWSGIYFDNVWLYDSGVTIDGPTDVGAVQYPNSAALTAFESKLKAVKWFVTFEFDDPGFAMGEVFQDPGGRNYVQVIPLNTPARKCYNEVRSALSKPSIAESCGPAFRRDRPTPTSSCRTAGIARVQPDFLLADPAAGHRGQLSRGARELSAEDGRHHLSVRADPAGHAEAEIPGHRNRHRCESLRDLREGQRRPDRPQGHGFGSRFTCPVSGRGSRVSVVVTALDTAMNKTVARKTVRIRG